MRSSKPYILRRLILAGLMVILPARGVWGSDLWGMFDLAKKKDPVLQKSEAQLKGALEDKKIAVSQMLPRVDGTAGVNAFMHEIFGTGTSSATSRSLSPFVSPFGALEGPFPGYSYSAVLRQPIFNGPQWAMLNYSDAGIRGSRDRVSVASQDLMVKVSDAYFAVLKARSDALIALKEEDRLTRILQQTKSFLEKGTGDIIAVYEAQARVDSSHALVIKAQNDRRVAEQRLAILTGVSEILELAGLSSLEPAEPNPASVDKWLEMAIQSHPAIEQARESLHMAEYNSTATKRLHWPTLDLTGGYTVSAGSTFLPRVGTRQWLVGVNLTVPIFSSFGTQAKIRKSLAAVSEQEAAVRDSLEQVRLRTETLFLTVKNSVTFINSLVRQRQSAEVQLKATKKGNTIGTRTIVDLLNAEQRYAASLRDLANASYDHLLYEIQLKAAAGTLVEDDLRRTSRILSIKVD